MPKYRHGSGSIYQRGKTWWMSYYCKGMRIRESSGTSDRAEARRLLQARLGQIAERRFSGPAADRVMFKDLAEMIVTDYKVNGKKSLPDLEQKIRLHLRPFFGGKPAHGITTADVKAYTLARQEAGAANAKVNRELAALKRMFNLAIQAEKITRKPYIPMLAENNVRQGFFEPWEFDAVFARLPDWLRPPVKFSYITGWRMRSEVLTLTWAQVDLAEGEVRLEPGTTKNKDARPFPFTQELRALIEVQWQGHLAHYPDCPLVFHDHGRPIVNYRKRWIKACQEAGVQDKLVHDMRRTAIRQFNRLGITDKVAMALSGHKTRSVYDRYNIVSKGDLKEAARRLDGASQGSLVTTLGTTILTDPPALELSH